MSEQLTHVYVVESFICWEGCTLEGIYLTEAEGRAALAKWETDKALWTEGGADSVTLIKWQVGTTEGGGRYGAEKGEDGLYHNPSHLASLSRKDDWLYEDEEEEEDESESDSGGA